MYKIEKNNGVKIKLIIEQSVFLKMFRYFSYFLYFFIIIIDNKEYKNDTVIFKCLNLI